MRKLGVRISWDSKQSGQSFIMAIEDGHFDGHAICRLYFTSICPSNLRTSALWARKFPSLKPVL